MKTSLAIFAAVLCGCASKNIQLPPPAALQLEAGKLNVTMSIIPQSAAERITSKSFARDVSIWTVSLANLTADTAAIGESAVIDRAPELQPHGLIAAIALAGDASSNSFISWATKLSEDALIALIYASAHSGLRGSWPIIAADANALGPYFLGRLKTHDRPLAQNVNLLSWATAVKLGPGDTATRYLFTRRWADNAPARHFVIDTSNLKPVKLLQSQ